MTFKQGLPNFCQLKATKSKFKLIYTLELGWKINVIILTIMDRIFLIIVKVLEWAMITPKCQIHSRASVYWLHFRWRDEQYAITTPSHLTGRFERLSFSMKNIFLECRRPERGILWHIIETIVIFWSLSKANIRPAPATGWFAKSRSPWDLTGDLRAMLDRFFSKKSKGRNLANASAFITLMMDFFSNSGKWRAYESCFTRFRQIAEPWT